MIASNCFYSVLPATQTSPKSQSKLDPSNGVVVINRLVGLRLLDLIIMGMVSTAAKASLITVKFDGFSQGRTVVHQSLDGKRAYAYAGMQTRDH